MRVARMKSFAKKTKRGDTIVEVMFAFAIFSLVAVVTVSMMNLGLATGERSLELVTARSELNAQAEALRFVHSSYISELTLPKCGDLSASEILNGKKCQQFDKLWGQIIAGARESADSVDAGNAFSIKYPLETCQEVYEDDNTLLRNNHAFVVNTRKLLPDKYADGGMARDESSIIGADDSTFGRLFVEPTLNARIVYSNRTGVDGDDGDNNSEKNLGQALTDYTKIASIEGIWVVAVKGPIAPGRSKPQYYDFYIQTCWYGSNQSLPSMLDTVIRLYNPEGA